MQITQVPRGRASGFLENRLGILCWCLFILNKGILVSIYPLVHKVLVLLSIFNHISQDTEYEQQRKGFQTILQIRLNEGKNKIKLFVGSHLFSYY